MSQTGVATIASPFWELAAMSRARSRRILAHGVCAVLTLLIGVSSIASNRPLETHEIFVAQTAQEMLDRGEWATPYFNGEPRLVKPPLMYWLVMGTHSLGLSPGVVAAWEARLPSLIAALALVAVTVELGWLCAGAGLALVSGMLASTCTVVVTHATTARPETLYGALCAAMLLGFIRADASPDRSRTQRLWALLAWGAAGAACLAKGPHLPLIMTGGAFLWFLRRGEARRFLTVANPLPGAPLALLLVVPWPVAVLATNPEAASIWNEQLIGNSGADAGRGVLSFVSGYYLYAVPQILLPWAVVLPLAVVSAWRQRLANPLVGLLLAVVVTTIVVMTIPNHRRGYYLLPIVAPMCVLLALGLLDGLTAVASAPRGAMWVRNILTLAATASIGFGAGVAAHGGWSERAIIGVALATAVCGFVMHRVVRMRGLSVQELAVVAATGMAICWGASLAGVAGEHALWGERRYALAGFANDVAATMDRNASLRVMDVEPAPFVYALQSPVERVRARDGFEQVAVPGAWFVAATARQAALREAGLAVEVVFTNEQADDHPGGLSLYRVGSPAPGD